jgi:gamma-glutamyltranspeptidase/glutathione hydrolase
MRVTTTVLALAVFVVSAIGFAGDGEVDLSPGSWPEGEFEKYSELAGMIQSKTEVLGRRLDTKAIFTRENGEWYQTGDLFQQPELAHTLRMVARHGAGYMYSGPWAEKLVAAVQSEGGAMTMEDLESYEVLWSEPSHSTFKGYDVYTPPPPNLGGVNMLEALNLVELAGLPEKGHPTDAPEAFLTMARIDRVSDVLGTSLTRHVTPTEMIEKYVGGLDLDLDHRVTKEAAAVLWAKMQTPGWATLDRESLEWRPAEQFGNHSDAVVAVDQWGNVCAVVHTINTSLWGDTGIFVGGIPIADSAKYQQEKIRRTGPGKKLQLETNPLIVVKDGRPAIASSSIGMGVHEQTLQSLVNILDYGMDPREASYTPQLLRPYIGGASVAMMSVVKSQDVENAADQVVADGEFDDALLDQVRAMGLGITEVPAAASSGWRGYWVGIVVDPETGALQGAAPGLVAGWAEGY